MPLEERVKANIWFDFLTDLQREPTTAWSEDVSRVFSLIERYQPEKIISKWVHGIPVSVFIHSTKRGPALGGTRRLVYSNMANFLRDGLKLSAAMTYKAIWARVPRGGGKTTIYAAPEEITNEFLRGYAEFLNEINTPREVFVTGEDIGFSAEQVDIVAKYTPYISGKSTGAGGLGDPSPLTAKGIFLATKAIVESDDLFHGNLTGKVAAVQGAGKVGLPLIKMLLEANVYVYFSEPNDERAIQAEQLGAKRVDPDHIYRTPCHIFMPCALGGVINKHTIPQLSWMCRVIIGSANNILDTPEDGITLHQKEKVFAPDYVVNRWGLEWVCQEKQGITDVETAEKNLTNIVPDILNIWRISKERNVATSEVADTISRKVLTGEVQSIEECFG